MPETLAPITLVSLQSRLDSLDAGQTLTLAISDVRRLFGMNDVAQARISNFARGHGCATDAAPSSITFKKIRRVRPSP